MGGCETSTEPDPDGTPIPVLVEPITQTVLSGIVATEVAPAPTVRVVDGAGRPVSGVTVSFHASSAGLVGNRSGDTDAEGLASVGTWTLGPTAGLQRLTVRSHDLEEVVFAAVAGPGAVAQITPSSVEYPSEAPIGTVFQELRVRVADSFGNSITGATVAFHVIAGGGGVENAMAVTGADGVAVAGPWTLGSLPGMQQVSAESGPAQATFSVLAYGPPTALQGQLAFVSERDGNSEIYAAGPDGSGLRRLTTSGGRDDAPAWSAEGNQIAFASDRDGTASVYVMAANGSNVTRRTAGTVLYDRARKLAWSPTGAAIAFTTLRDGRVRIATVSTTDEAVVHLTDVAGLNIQPSWSPNGGKLAFVSDRNVFEGGSNIYTMNADGTGQIPVTHESSGVNDLVYYFHPTWSPDGSMIAFIRGTVINALDMRLSVGVMSADGGTHRILAWAGDTHWSASLDPGSLTWNPDGRGIAYTFTACDLSSGSDCTNEWSVNYMSLDGTERGTLVSNAHSPSWRP